MAHSNRRNQTARGLVLFVVCVGGGIGMGFISGIPSFAYPTTFTFLVYGALTGALVSPIFIRSLIARRHVALAVAAVYVLVVAVALMVQSFMLYVDVPVIVMVFGVLSAGVGWLLPVRHEPAHACQDCGYDLRSITSPRCPECGSSLGSIAR